MCDYEIERTLLKKGIQNICGVDEVGRGALFGPVVAGAVILDSSHLNSEIKDSKKLTHAKRLSLAQDIYKTARAYSIGWCWNDEIDRLNILQATKKAMKMAVNTMQVTPDYVLLDSIKQDFMDIPGEGIIRGDNKSFSIAAASIIAKVFRDRLLISFSKFFPGYDFENNKGYPTKKHINMISLKGKTEFHRKSFKV